jgi:hypothetical protein
MVLFGSLTCSPCESMLVACQKSSDEIEKLYCECFLSDYLKCEDYYYYYYYYYYIICPLRFPAIKSHTGCDLVNKEATVPSILFCHNKHSGNNALNLITNCVRMKHFGVNLLSQIKSEYINLE